jgi:hypothetical protein
MAKSNSQAPKQHVNKSAVTGKFVTENYAKKHPATTFKETVHKNPPKKK